MVTGSISTPAPRDSSFSGISPTDSKRVSQGMYSSVPGMGFREASTAPTVTPVTRSFPWIFMTVWLSFRGIPKSLRHWTMFRVSPPE